jgi:sigma-B regulation protein RsbU (phosphoserine phosphatase)
MSLKNEANQAYQSTRSFYKEYTKGMTREQLGREFHADSKRLMELYKEAVGDDVDEITGESVDILTKMERLAKALSIRMSPVRRLVFAGTFVLFIAHYFALGLISKIAFPVVFFGLVMLLLIELLEKLDVKKEIDLAREIQLSLLPSANITASGVQIVSFANTASEVGGDYVDVISTDKGTYYIIADVSGKGLSAALYMVRMQALVHLIITKFHPTPKELCLELNEYIKSNKQDKTFVTACVAFFPKNEDYFTIVRAGHNSPLLYKADKDVVLDLKTTGFALGMTTTQRLKLFMKETRINFTKDDAILMYTDGLNEARNEQNEEYGDSRVRSMFEIYGALEPMTTIKKMQNSLEQFIGSAKPMDDITFSCIKKN